MSKYEQRALRGGVGATPERMVHNKNRQGSLWDSQHDATHAMELASTLSRALVQTPQDKPDVSMTFSTRFYFFVLLAMVIVWKVLSAG